MMSQGRKTHFLYDLRTVLVSTNLDAAHHRAFGETLFARGTRMSTEDAKEFVRQKEAEQVFTRGESEAIQRLVEQYSFWR